MDVVLLDINLPGMSGHEVLSRIRANPELAALPVVMLSSSSDPRDLSEAFEKHANGYVVKPIDFAEFNETIGGVDRYWSRCCRLPRREQ
ncbi:MAG: response regulator [Planctomycetota bacterium]